MHKQHVCQDHTSQALDPAVAERGHVTAGGKFNHQTVVQPLGGGWLGFMLYSSGIHRYAASELLDFSVLKNKPVTALN